MTTSLIDLVEKFCVFALGSAFIYVARDRAAVVTRLLVGVAATTAALVALAAAGNRAPDDHGRFDEITVYAALSQQAPPAEP